MVRTVTLITLAAISWEGCTRGADPNTPRTGGPPAVTQPESTRAGQLAGALVYTRTGGFVGTDDRVMIQPGGRLEASGQILGNHAGELTAAEHSRLVAALADWPELKVSGQPPDGSADLFTHSITYLGRTVTWTDATPDVPAELTALAELVRELATSKSAP